MRRERVCIILRLVLIVTIGAFSLQGLIDRVVAAEAARSPTAESFLSEFFGGEPSVSLQESFQRNGHRWWRLDHLIVCLPDPVESVTGYRFDSFVDTLHKAMARWDYSLDRSYLPWPELPPAVERSLFLSDRPIPRPHLKEPGVLVYRRQGASLEVVIVYLLGETPTTGVHRESLEEALRLRGVLEGSTERSTDHYILGPTYSGSANSLQEMILDSAPADRRQRFQLISGTATNIDKNALETTQRRLSIQFSATIHPTPIVKAALLKYITDRELLPRITTRVAWLSESSAFGMSMDGQKESEQLQVTDFFFPMNVSQVRRELAETPETGNPEVPSLAERHYRLEVPLFDEIEFVSDQLHRFAPKITGSIVELTLAQIMTTIRDEGFRYVGITATDPRDQIFLASLVKQRAPNIQLLLLTTDMLFAHPNYRSQLNGAITASTYPLVSRNQRWSFPFEGGKNVLPLPSELDEGFYNACMVLLGFQEEKRNPENPRRLNPIDYGFPFANLNNSISKSNDSNPSLRPPLWISIIGNGEFFPLRVTPWKDALNCYEPLTSKEGNVDWSDYLYRVPDRVLEADSDPEKSNGMGASTGFSRPTNLLDMFFILMAMVSFGLVRLISESRGQAFEQVGRSIRPSIANYIRLAVSPSNLVRVDAARIYLILLLGVGALLLICAFCVVLTTLSEAVLSTTQNGEGSDFGHQVSHLLLVFAGAIAGMWSFSSSKVRWWGPSLLVGALIAALTGFGFGWAHISLAESVQIVVLGALLFATLSLVICAWQTVPHQWWKRRTWLLLAVVVVMATFCYRMSVPLWTIWGVVVILGFIVVVDIWRSVDGRNGIWNWTAVVGPPVLLIGIAVVLCLDLYFLEKGDLLNSESLAIFATLNRRVSSLGSGVSPILSVVCFAWFSAVWCLSRLRRVYLLHCFKGKSPWLDTKNDSSLKTAEVCQVSAEYYRVLEKPCSESRGKYGVFFWGAFFVSILWWILMVSMGHAAVDVRWLTWGLWAMVLATMVLWTQWLIEVHVVIARLLELLQKLASLPMQHAFVRLPERIAILTGRLLSPAIANRWYQSISYRYLAQLHTNFGNANRGRPSVLKGLKKEQFDLKIKLSQRAARERGVLGRQDVQRNQNDLTSAAQVLWPVMAKVWEKRPPREGYL